MKHIKTSLVFILSLLLIAIQSQAESAGQKPTLENLMKTVLERVPDTEIIVSRVEVPPNSSLAKHWHPGEEFAYVLAGSVILWQKDKEDILVQTGEVIKIPAKQIHTAVTKNEGTTLLVFRVHEQGKPERVLVEKSVE